MKNVLPFLKRSGLFIFHCLSLIVLTVTVALAQDAEIKSAMHLVDIDKPVKATEVINKALTTYPEAAKLYYYLGLIQIQTGDYDQAIRSFEKGIALNDKEALNHAGMGHALLLKKKPTEAKTSLDRALSLSKSKDVPVLHAVSRAYLTDAKTSKNAVTLLEKAKGLDDRNTETRILLGDAYLLENNGGSAVNSYEWAAQFDPKDAKPHYKIGEVYMRSQNTRMVEESLTKAVSIDPEYTLAYKELGELYYLKKDGAQAVKNYEKYLSLTENPDKEQFRYAFMLFMAKDYPKANGIFKNLVARPDVTPKIYRYYAFSLFESVDYMGSKAAFEQYFTKIKPEETEASDYAYYGKLLLKLNEDSLATMSLQKSLALEKNQELSQLLAETYFKSKKYPEAIEQFKSLMAGRSKPSSQDYYFIGRAYYFNNQFVEADSAFLKLIEMQPNMTVGYLWDGRAKSNLDPETEAGLAKPYYEMLIEKALPTPDKNKNDLIEAYSYLGYYHFLKQELQLAKSYWTKVITLNPNDEKAKEALKALNQN